MPSLVRKAGCKMLVDRIQRLIPSLGGGDDHIGVGGPDEGFGLGVVLGEVAVDGGLKIDQRMEHAALEPALGEPGEEGLDRVEPGGRGRGEVEGPARMARQLGQHPRFREGRLLGCLWVAELSSTTWMSLPAGISRSRRFRNRRNSWWRCRAIH